jgi:hypothetical protein
VEYASQRRRDGAKAWNELGQQQRARSLLRENALGAANARIWLERNFAEKLENAYAFAAAKLVPDKIRGHRGEHNVKERSEKTQVAGSRERPGREQQGHGRQGQANLLGKDPPEQDYVPVMEEKFESTVHVGPGSDLRLLLRERSSMPPVTGHDKL